MTDGIPAAAASADHTATPELEGQSRHEDERITTTVDQDMPGAPCAVILLGAALWKVRITTGLASPSEFIPAQQLAEHRSPRISSPHAMNATHGDRPRASATPRLHLRTPSFSQHYLIVGFSLVDATRQPKKLLQMTTAWQPTYVDRPTNKTWDTGSEVD